MGNNLQILLCLADLESPGAGRGVAIKRIFGLVEE
jgi:hypothetical protein